MLKNNGPFADFFKMMYIPPWRVAAAERKLKEFASNGYELLSFSHIGLSFYYTRFQCTAPKEKDYYLYARFQGGKGPSLGLYSPCGKEKQKTASITRKMIYISSNIFAAEIDPDIDSAIVLNYRKEKLRAARKLYASFLLFELSILPALFIFCYFFVPHEILFREPITVPPSLYPFAVFPIYATIAALVLTKELKWLRHS